MSSTNKNKLIALAFFVVFPLFLARTAQSFEFETEGVQVIHAVPPQTLDVLKLLFAIIAGLTFSIPWFLYKKIKSYQPTHDLIIAKFKVGNPGLLLGYLYLFSPVIYGLILFFVGMSISGLYYYIGTSIIGALVWGILDFRRM